MVYLEWLVCRNEKVLQGETNDGNDTEHNLSVLHMTQSQQLYYIADPGYWPFDIDRRGHRTTTRNRRRQKTRKHRNSEHVCTRWSRAGMKNKIIEMCTKRKYNVFCVYHSEKKSYIIYLLVTVPPCALCNFNPILVNPQPPLSFIFDYTNWLVAVNHHQIITSLFVVVAVVSMPVSFRITLSYK
jgi:hypothetical protein